MPWISASLATSPANTWARPPAASISAATAASCACVRPVSATMKSLGREAPCERGAQAGAGADTGDPGQRRWAMDRRKKQGIVKRLEA
jgi:hypothetical protein